MMKQLGDNQVEFLVDRSTKLQNRGLGAHAPQSLLMHLRKNGRGLSPCFYVHVYVSRNAAMDDYQHSYCQGVIKCGEYQSSRILYQSLRKGFKPLGGICAFIASPIANLLLDSRSPKLHPYIYRHTASAHLRVSSSLRSLPAYLTLLVPSPVSHNVYNPSQAPPAPQPSSPIPGNGPALSLHAPSLDRLPRSLHVSH